MKILLLCALTWLCCFSIFASKPHAGERESPPYTLFRQSPDNPDTTLPNIHPYLNMADMVEEKHRNWDYGNNWIMLSVQEGELLKVVFYRPGLKFRGFRFDVHNPTKRDITGMPARLFPNGEVLLADGTWLKACLPPDAKIIGGGDWSRDIRWKRVYKNYYYLTLYNGPQNIRYDGIVTEKDGRDMYPLFGESSATTATKKFYGNVNSRSDKPSWRDLFYISYLEGSITEVVNIVRVDEQDLPPDFPKGLVRWIP